MIWTELWDGTYIDGFYLSDCSLISSSGTRTTNLIPVTAGEYYIFSGGNRCRLRWLDSEDACLFSEDAGNTANPIMRKAPVGAVNVQYYYYNAPSPDPSVLGVDQERRAEVVLSPTKDTFASQNAPDTNYGSAQTLLVLGTSGSYRRSYLKFDLPDIDPSKIAYAEFCIFYQANDISSREQRHHIKRITSDWNEDTLTYNSAPTFNGSTGITDGSYGKLENIDGHNTGVMKWRYANLTNLIKEWLAGTYDNYGIVIDHNYNTSYDGGIWANITYRSSEYEDPDYHPYLKIVYEKAFDPSGTYITPPIDVSELPSEIRFKYLSETPAGTNISVEYIIEEDYYEPDEYDSWESIENDDTISLPNPAEGYNLWLKFTLTTTDPDQTPLLTDVWLEEVTPDAKRIKINLTYDGRMKHPQGEVTVDFTGSMSGALGSQVAPFDLQFTPQDLVIWFNPNDPEYISAVDASIVSAIRLHITYSSAEDESDDMHYLTLADASITNAIRTHIDDIET